MPENTFLIKRIFPAGEGHLEPRFDITDFIDNTHRYVSQSELADVVHDLITQTEAPISMVMIHFENGESDTIPSSPESTNEKESS